MGVLFRSTARHFWSVPAERRRSAPAAATSIGVASWPTPLHVTCCGSLGGGGIWYPWRRYLYWHLSWAKADGARLDMLARFEQKYESGSGWNDHGAASLVRLNIRPARAYK